MSLFQKPEDPRKVDKEKIKALAEEYGTPLYAYDKGFIERQYKRLCTAFEKQGIQVKVHYSVKASSTLGILKLMKAMGSSFDVVSGGELERCLRAGATGDDIVFSGVGKTREEIRLGIETQILQFNVESSSELEMIEEEAKKLGKTAQVAMRINPNVDALTHEFITTGTYESKFGVSIEEAQLLYHRFKNSDSVKWVGLDMHIGSQLTEREPIKMALKRFAIFVQDLAQAKIPIRYLDIGGGLGINYSQDKVISPEEFAKIVHDSLDSLDLNQDYQLIIEPGRFIVAESGVLISRVIHMKRLNRKVYAITDSGMSELMRPSLYGAHHEIVAVSASGTSRTKEATDIVGPICESTDYFAKDRNLPRLQQGDYIAVLNCGAYASCMAHNYNTRPKATEVLVDGDKKQVIRRRETLEDIFKLEEV